MKKIGIVGGVGWQSTVDYYSQLCRRSQQLHAAKSLPGVATIPEVSIESLDLAKALSYLGSDEDESSWAEFDQYHRDALRRLQASGVEVALIASNTPHHRFEAIIQGIQIPVISILQELAKKAARIAAKDLLLLGTALTMRSQRFRDEFNKYGIEAHSPPDEVLRGMTLQLIADLQFGKSAGAAERLLHIAKRSLGVPGGRRSAVCLACTELPLAFEAMNTRPDFEYEGMLFINSTAVHVDAAFNFAAGGNSHSN